MDCRALLVAVAVLLLPRCARFTPRKASHVALLEPSTARAIAQLGPQRGIRALSSSPAHAHAGYHDYTVPYLPI